MAISDQASEKINQKIDRAAVASMFDLGNVLELIDHRLNNGPLAQQDLVDQVHQAVLHVGFDLGDELQPEGLHKLFEERL